MVPRAAVESRLEPRRVVALGAARGRRRRPRARGRRDRPSLAPQERPAAVAAKQVLGENDLALAVVLSAGDHDGGAALRRRLPRIPDELVADELDSRCDDRQAVRRREVQEDPGARVADDLVPGDVHVERRLAAIGRPDMQAGGTRPACTGEEIAGDA